MKLISIFAIVFFCLPTQAQVYVNGEDINAMDITYCRATVYGRTLLSKEVRVFIDFGEWQQLNQRQEIGSDRRNRRKFASEVDVLNFMDQQGWDMVDTYVEVSETSGAPTNYIFKRKEN